MNSLSTTVGPFAMSTALIVWLICAGVAAVVGHFVGRSQNVNIGGILVDMALTAALAARLAFVALWFDHYRATPWSILDIRDGGFTPWVGIVAAGIIALWQVSRRVTLRAPLAAGLLAGTLTWTVSLAVLRLGEGPTLSGLDELSFTTLQDKPLTLTNMALGKPLVINLWATWCPPCRSEIEAE